MTVNGNLIVHDMLIIHVDRVLQMASNVCREVDDEVREERLRR